MKIRNLTSIHLFRQALAAVSTCLQSLSAGMAAGYSAVLLPQLKEDDSIEYDASYDSWVAAIFPLSMSFGCVIAGPFIDRFGRRLGLLLNAIPFFLGWLIISFSNNFNVLLLGRAITGLCSGAFRPMSLIYISEVTDPKYRAVSLVSLLLLSNTGVLIVHSVGTCLYWKTAAIILGVPNLLSAVVLLYLRESPLWLISSGKPDEGIDCFNWFRARDEAADKELNEVISKQIDKSEDYGMKDLLKVVISKSFMGAFAVTVVIFIEVQFSGNNTLTFYALDMIKSTFSDDVDNVMVMLIIDALRIAGTGIIICIVKYVPRRFLFLICSILTTVFLFCLAAFLYFETEILWFGVLSLVLYIIFSVTLISIGWSFVGEVYPSSARGVGSALTSTFSYIMLFVAVKITPWIIDTYSMSVYYSLTGCITAICTVILYFVLPETNGKTLQEIENSLHKENYIGTTQHTKL